MTEEFVFSSFCHSIFLSLLLCLWQLERYAKAQVAVAKMGRVGVAHGAAAIGGHVAPAAAAHGKAALLVQVGRVGYGSLRRRAGTGRAKLPHVAEHVA